MKLSIIIEYFKQGFSKYFDEETDPNYKKNMNFGDVVIKADNQYYVLDINFCDLQPIGCYDAEEQCVYVNLVIPISICEHLDNAISFFSKFDKTELFQKDLKTPESFNYDSEFRYFL